MESPATVVLWWIPVGAGGHVVRHTSRLWELINARRVGRAPAHLYHAALAVTVDGASYVIEMAPAWSGPRAPDRGVVVTGPVGARVLGGCRLFRYEVRCWRGGAIPDLQWAVGGPKPMSASPEAARAVLGCAAAVPNLTWGRTVTSSDDMWNSNSVIAWLLVRAGVACDGLHPPAGGRAPGWDAGLVLARGSSDGWSSA